MFIHPMVVRVCFGTLFKNIVYFFNRPVILFSATGTMRRSERMKKESVNSSWRKKGMCVNGGKRKENGFALKRLRL